MIATAPLTNIAALLHAHPETASSIKEIVLMGGAAFAPGNVTPSAEFNFFADPEAARFVTEAGVPPRIVGLDVTRKALTTRADIDELLADGRPATTAAGRILDHATTYAHDSHNLTVTATTAAALREAANRVIASDGGICVIAAGDQPVHLPLPVAGVLSDRPAEEVSHGAAAIREALHRWGWVRRNAFMSISTMTLPVSPQVKLTDPGLVRVVDRAWEPAVLT